MNLDRVLKYCKQSIDAERKKSTPSIEKIKALEEILNFINTADAPQPSERETIKEIFQKHHKDFKGTKYVFTKNQDAEIDGIIVQIKEEMIENVDVYSDMTLTDFFELFITNMDVANSDDFWRRNQFTTWGINKNFRKILSQILSSVNKRSDSGKKYGHNKNKPTYSSVMNP